MKRLSEYSDRDIQVALAKAGYKSKRQLAIALNRNPSVVNRVFNGKSIVIEPPKAVEDAIIEVIGEFLPGEPGKLCECGK